MYEYIVLYYFEFSFNKYILIIMLHFMINLNRQP